MPTPQEKVAQFKKLVELHKKAVRKANRDFVKFAKISAAWKKAQRDFPL